ncbi:MAG: Mrp/NBP35 family ATP-binding protein [Candidatus Eisenbacteria sp.]|nr:Mrp/NBP35 family ATP-binding protein [Candidatus Eisenbacteria bacterium]
MARVEDIIDILKKVPFPGLDQDIVSLGYVKEVGRQDGQVRIRMEIATSDAKAAQTIEREVRRRLDEAGVNYDLQVTNPAAPQASRGQDAQQAPGGQVQFEDLLPDVKRKIAIASGKGGVGKSTVAVNLALALREHGEDVGLLDADIYGPSMPTMLGVTQQTPKMVGEKVDPIVAHGIRAMSLGFLAAGTDPIIWRGPLASRAIEQLMSDVEWSGTQTLILDLPPGTGDIQISIAQKGNLSGAIVVTTPQDVALIDAIKGVRMFQKMNVPVLGIVENMSYFECPHCRKRSEIFPRGHLQEELDKLGMPLLGTIPIDPAIAAGGDSGRPILIATPESAAARAFKQLAAEVNQALAQ